MLRKSAARVLIALCFVAVPSSAWSQMQADKALVTLAGSYLHSVEQLRLLRKSKCAYLIPDRYPTFRQLLETDILPALPEADRERMRRGAEQFLTSREPENQGNLEAQIQKLTTAYDDKTACGFIAGTYIAVFEGYKLRWDEIKKGNPAASK